MMIEKSAIMNPDLNYLESLYNPDNQLDPD